jgi:hypothetical protein
MITLASLNSTVARGPLGPLDGEGLGRDLGEDEQQQRHPDRGHQLAGRVEVAHGERRRDGRAADREEQGQEQHDVQVGRRILHDAHERGGAPPTLLQEPHGADAVHPRDRHLSGGIERHQDDGNGDRHDRHPVGPGHGTLTPLYRSWRAHISVRPASSSWS